MPYLGIDLDPARELAQRLTQASGGIREIVALIIEAETRSDLASHATGLLDDVGREYSYVSRLIAAAADTAESFRFDPLSPNRWTALKPARWNATLTTPWNQVHQDASHNTYQVTGGIAELYRTGVRSFELDIHRGAPTELVPALPAPLAAVQVALDHFDHRGGRHDDWRIYHVSGSSASEYQYLSDGLAEVAGLGSSDPLTIFIDNKDDFGGTHVPAQFDLIVQRELGERLFTPDDLLRRAPGTSTLRQAIAVAGWPTVQELNGRVIVVLTDQVQGYEHGEHDSPSVFIAQSPDFAVDTHDGVRHVPDPNVVFYNAAGSTLSPRHLAAIAATSSVLRTYGNAHCGAASFDSATLDPDSGPSSIRSSAQATVANYRAIDITPGDTQCSAPVPHPPEGTPVPIKPL